MIKKKIITIILWRIDIIEKLKKGLNAFAPEPEGWIGKIIIIIIDRYNLKVAFI